MRIRRLAHRSWELLGGWKAALLALALLTVSQGLSFALPQIPVSAKQSAAYNLWLAVYRAQLGQATRPLAALGLLTLRTSPWLRGTLALVGLIVAAHLGRLVEGSSTTEPPRRIGRLMLCLGGLLIIGGWTAQMLGGWRDPEVIVWPDEQLPVVNRGAVEASGAPVIAQPAGPLAVWPGGYGRYVLARGQRIGLEVEAYDAGGQRLPIQRTVGEDPQTHVRLAFTTPEPEAFFAILEAGLIFRLNQIGSAIQLQAYRSASGELLTETLLESTEASARLQLDNVEVLLTQTFLPRYEVVYNPGAAPEALGLILFASGTILEMVHQRATTRCAAEASDEDEELAES
jgi:hypothetical protein